MQVSQKLLEWYETTLPTTTRFCVCAFYCFLITFVCVASVVLTLYIAFCCRRSRTLSGYMSLCVKTYAEALEVIPYTLAENAGLKPVEIVTELRTKHAAGDTRSGINVKKVTLKLFVIGAVWDFFHQIMFHQ